MRIAYVVNATILTGGSAKSFIELLSGIRNYGVTPIVILPDTGGIYQQVVDMGIEIYTVPLRPQAYPSLHGMKDGLFFLPRLFTRIIINYLGSRKLTRLLQDKAVDIIHSNVSIINIGYNCAISLGIPHIYHVREYLDLDFGIHYFPTQASIRHQFHQPHSYTICITKDIQRHHGLSENPNSRVIYNGIQAKSGTLPPSCQKEFFLYVGRIETTKGLADLIDAYAKYVSLTVSPIPLHIAGKVREVLYYEKVKKSVEKYQIAHLVRFLGETNQVYELMRKAYAIVIPSQSEGFGRCMAEAMFNGCLVIGRYTGGTKEQYDNGMKLQGAEIALKYDTNQELTKCLEKVASGSEDFTSYKERAFQTVNTLYTREVNTAQIFQFYKEIHQTTIK